MTCAAISQQIPWFLNGTLSAQEAAEVWSHLQSCQGCRQHLKDSEFAWVVFEQHIPTALMVAHVGGDVLANPARRFVAQHLRECSQCREELAMTKESLLAHQTAQARPVEANPAVAPKRHWPRYLALAAVFFAGMGMGFLIHMQSVSTANGFAETPFSQTMALDLFPNSMQTRAGEEDPLVVEIPREMRSITLVFNSLLALEQQSLICRFQEDGQNPGWQDYSLQRGADGTFALSLATSQFREGKRYAVLVTPSTEERVLETYHFVLKLRE